MITRTVMITLFALLCCCAASSSPCPRDTPRPSGDFAEDDLVGRVAVLEERLEQAEALLAEQGNALLVCQAEVDATQDVLGAVTVQVNDLKPTVEQLRSDVDTLWPAVEQVQRDLRECECGSP